MSDISDQTQSRTMPNIPYDDSPLSRQSAFALFWLFIYSIAMFTLPFAAFFGTRYILQTKYNLDTFTITCSSVIAAVLTVNIIIVMYAIKGYREVDEDKPENPESSTEIIDDKKEN